MGDDFESRAKTRSRSQIVELLAFMRENQKWWLVPVIVALLLFAGLMMLSSTAAAPFIYTVF